MILCRCVERTVPYAFTSQFVDYRSIVSTSKLPVLPVLPVLDEKDDRKSNNKISTRREEARGRATMRDKSSEERDDRNQVNSQELLGER